MIGQVIGKCRIDGIIGSGAMGIVYRAQHQALGIPVALKMIKPELSRAPEQLARFLQEAQLAARLRHPNIVRVYDVGTEEGHHFIVMELLEGIDLERYIEERVPMDLDTFFHLFMPLATALGEAHSKGVIHRDIKPDNIMMVEGNRPVVTDFGIGAAVSMGSRLTAPGFTMGTPAYMSPEQAKAVRDLDSRSDIFSLGMIMYQALTGQVPQESSNLLDILTRRVSEEIPSITTVNSSVPPALEEVINRSLRLDPLERYDDGNGLARALEKAYRSSHPRRTMTGKIEVELSMEVDRVVTLPGDETQQIVREVDIRDADLFALLGEAERSATGFGLLLIYYRSSLDLLVLSRDHHTRFYRWTGEGPRQVNLEDILSRFDEEEQGFISTSSISEAYYWTLLTVLTSPPSIKGLRVAFTQIKPLFSHIRSRAFSGVVSFGHQGQLAFMVFHQGETTRLYSSTWLGEPAPARPVNALMKRVLERPETVIDLHPTPMMPPRGSLPREESLYPEEIKLLATFVVRTLRESGKAMTRAFGLGTDSLMTKHLLLAAEEFPLLFEGMSLDRNMTLDSSDLMARIEGLPRTGRRRIVLAGLRALLDARVEGYMASLHNRRKLKKVLTTHLEEWRKIGPHLQAQGLAEPFVSHFADVQATLQA